jgi:beta-lactam-binding protein with PASTA domain
MPHISDSIGRVLGTRYRLISALGTGASAHVFLAEDVSLQRHVAVKVLQPGLATDAAFLKRFGAEARSVASLNHPHVLRVFDWGEDADGPYLVLEYLGGGSLRDLLDQGVRLSHAQAAQLGTEVAQGLAYAHSRGLVHRDIKPANLLFDEEGRVRVADFGVARALAEAAWTEPAGAMIGTARYASPEAAEGKRVDGRADVYSLALVLYEAVTGVVPFVADTTLGTLMARVGAPLPPNSALGPLDEVLARAAAPNVTQRLDAAGLAARLSALASALPVPQPLPLRPPQPVEAAPATGFRAPGGAEQTQIVVPGGLTAATAPVGTRAGPGEVFDAEPGGGETPWPTAGQAAVAAGAGGAVIAPRRKSRKKLLWTLAVVVVVLALAAGALLAIKDKAFTPSHPVPALVGLTLAQAKSAAAKDHFTLKVDPGKTSITVAAGSVISQQPMPKAGRKLKQGSTLNVVPSSGPPPVTVPSLAGATCASAAATLTAAHLVPSCGTGQYSSTISSGVLISWSYGSTANPTTAPYGATITLVPSEGHAPVDVPPLPAGYTYAQAAAAIQAVGLVPAQVPASSTTVAAGQIISSSPASGAPAAYGSTVTVTVSSGPPTVAVPDVVGDSVAQAEAALQSDGLVVGGPYGPNAQSSKAVVITTTPAAGTTIPTGHTVNLYTD